MSRVVYRFGRFCLKPEDRSLSIGEVRVATTPKVFDTLYFFLRHPGRLVSKSELISEIWPQTFVEEGTLARTISDLRKVLRDGEEGAKFIETVPKFGYRWSAPVEIEEVDTHREEGAEPHPLPEPLVQPAPAPLDSTTPAREVAEVPTNWKRVLAFATPAVLVLAILIYLIARPANPAIHSLGVLPLKPANPASHNEILEFGTADTVISRLSRHLDIPVRFIKAKAESPAEDSLLIGRRSKVDAVLEGTLQQNGPTVRINMRLLRVSDGKTLWSGTFQESGGDLFAIEDAIASQVTPLLAVHVNKLRPGGPFRKPPLPAAHQHYQQGRYYFSRRTRGDFQNAIDHLSIAVQIDPGYAEAYSALAETYLIFSGYAHLSQKDVVEQVRWHTGKALELDPQLSAPHRILGMLAENFDYDRKTAEREYRLAIQIDPNDAVTRHYLGELLGLMGRFEEAEKEMAASYVLDPTSLIQQTDWAKIALFARKFDLALQRVDKVLEVDPRFEPAYGQRFTAFLSAGDLERAKLAFEEHKRLAGGEGYIQPAFLAGAAGRREEALRLIQERIRMNGFKSTFNLAKAYAIAGELDTAIDLLEQLEKGHDAPGMIGLEVDPQFDNLRRHPRFQALLQRIGAVEPPVVKAVQTEEAWLKRNRQAPTALDPTPRRR